MKNTPFHLSSKIAVQLCHFTERSLHNHVYKAVALTLHALILLSSTSAFGQYIPPGLPGANLEEQLDIPLNNGIQGPERNQADYLVRRGGQAQQQGNSNQAIANWLQALDIYQQIGDLEGEGLVYDYLGVTYAKLGRYQEAEDALRRRVGIARTRQDLQGQIFGLNNLGTLLLQAGKIAAAQDTFAQALNISRSVRNIAGEGLSLSNLGLTAAASGNYEEAIKRYETALNLRRQSVDPQGEANTRNNLGDAYRAVKQHRNALVLYRSALRQAETSRDFPNQFRALRGLVQSNSALRLYPPAFQAIRQHLALAQQQENRFEQLLSLQLAADLYRVTGDLAMARQFYEQAIALAGALGDTQAQAILRNDLAQVIYSLPKL